MERILRNTLRSGRFLNVAPERSRAMGKIRSKGNKSTEQLFRLSLVRAGIRGWVLHPKFVFGTPDFYFQKEKIAVFIDGCFWHGCKTCGHIPKTRSLFWKMKFERNRKRCRVVRKFLDQQGILVVRFWEHELKEQSLKPLQTIQRMLEKAA